MRLFLILLLTILVLANSMFDLFPGSWSGPLGADETLQVKIGDVQSKSMQWVYTHAGKTVTATGYYQVTAVKDSHNTTFTVARLEPASGSLSIGNLTVKQGDAVRTILRFQGDNLEMTAFDPEIAPVLTCTLKKE